MDFGLTTPVELAGFWRLWTCHLIHWDARHLLLNLVAAIPPIALLRNHDRRRLLAWAFFCAPLISGTVLASGFSGEYRGASGLVMGMWVFAGLTLVRRSQRVEGFALLLLAITKLVLESTNIWPAMPAEFVTVTVVHYAGAMAGLAGLLPFGVAAPAEEVSLISG